MVLSGIFMFEFVYKISNSYKAGVISAILYVCAPYHLMDFYNRVAIAELASFVFLPMVFSGIYDLFYTETKKTYRIIIGAIGLILSHTVITLYTAIFCLIYVLIHFKKLITRETIKKILLSVIIILLCTSFYIIPFFEHMFTTNYEVFLPDRMYSNEVINSSKLNIIELLFTEHLYRIYHIGFAIIIGLICCFIYRKTLSSNCKKNIKIFAIFGTISVIMTLNIFPFEYLPNCLKILQFVWRMLEFESLFFSIIAGIGFACYINKHTKDEMLIVIFLIAYMSMSVILYLNMTEEPFNEEEYLEPIKVTARTRICT
jgi:hypothetical protein